MSATWYVCSKCGAKILSVDPEREHWLIARHKHIRGRMVIRCPQHITEYALRIAEHAGWPTQYKDRIRG